MRRSVSLLASSVLVLAVGMPVAQSATTTKTWTSPDGALRFRYPASWYRIDNWNAKRGGESASITVQNVSPVGRSAGNGEFVVRFWREAKPAGATVASLRAKDCSNGDAMDKVLSCETVSINGRSWSWVNTLSATGGEGDGDRGRVIATVANGWVYRGIGVAPAGNLQAQGLAETKTILESVVINGSSLPATGVDTSPLWLGALLLVFGGYALRHVGRNRHPREPL